MDYEEEEGKMQLLEYIDELDEKIIQVTEIKMDDEVSPSMSKVTITTYWSDSDDEIDEEAWAVYQRSLGKKEVMEDEMDFIDSLEWMFGVEEKVENELCELDEFLDLKIEGFPEYEEVGEFDPACDFEFFEALLEDMEVGVEEEHHN